MKRKTFITFLTGNAVGIAGWALWTNLSSTYRHWSAVFAYSSAAQDMRNYRLNPDSGLYDIDLPPEPIEHLMALESIGEIVHLDIPFPTVPYSNTMATKYWVDYCNEHSKDIIYASGNPIHQGLEAKG